MPLSDYDYTWTCHQCHASNSPIDLPSEFNELPADTVYECVECSHVRCESCVLTQHKRRRGSTSTSTSTSLSSEPSDTRAQSQGYGSKGYGALALTGLAYSQSFSSNSASTPYESATHHIYSSSSIPSFRSGPTPLGPSITVAPQTPDREPFADSVKKTYWRPDSQRKCQAMCNLLCKVGAPQFCERLHISGDKTR